MNEIVEKFRQKVETRINLLKEREEECLEVGDTETAARCSVAWKEIERCIDVLKEVV
ncbi:MAG: hypothetical protein NC218_01775 [Acetobacter sp.]|nr:hypothetical protein [Acetobacter sp.]